MRIACLFFALVVAPALPAWAQASSAAAAGGQASSATAAGGRSLEELIRRFQSDAPKVEAEVRIEAWVEPGDGGDRPDQMVITLLPEGDTKLNADPGITVTPAAGGGVDWQVALPHRHQDMTITYFEPQAEIRMPFTATGSGPIELLVEYAYCLVDYQCFFGEETLSVALGSQARSG